MTSDRSQDDPTHAYWRNNLAGWSGFYDEEAGDRHLESIHGPAPLRAIYLRSIARLERSLVRDRLRLCRAFIADHVRPGMTITDVGCGTGILTLELLRKGASVIAIDFTAAALEATQRRVLSDALGFERLTCVLLDVRRERAPSSDGAIAIGIAPYVPDLDAFFSNALDPTGFAYCHFLDRSHWANRLRSVIPQLNVRDVRYIAVSDVDARYRRHGFALERRDRLGTGFLDAISRRTIPTAS